jgi:hypothetical protein
MSNLFPISDDQRKLFGELLWNALAESPEENWADYDAVMLTYVQVAPVWMLESSRDSLPEAVQGRIDAELQSRKA